jgi:isocitrate dehydrogenase (NAD+)
VLSVGNIETRSLSPNVISRNVAIRNELDLFVNVLHCVSYPGVPSRHKDIDIYVVRQNTEGEYAMMEHEVIKCSGSCSSKLMQNI